MHLSARSKVGLLFSLITVLAIVGAFLLSATVQPHGTHATSAAGQNVFKFKLVAAPGISACLPHASGEVVITRGKVNDEMTVKVEGLPANTGFDLFQTERAQPFRDHPRGAFFAVGQFRVHMEIATLRDELRA